MDMFHEGRHSTAGARVDQRINERLRSHQLVCEHQLNTAQRRAARRVRPCLLLLLSFEHCVMAVLLYDVTGAIEVVSHCLGRPLSSGTPR
jgi:hypothetical protein